MTGPRPCPAVENGRRCNKPGEVSISVGLRDPVTRRVIPDRTVVVLMCADHADRYFDVYAANLERLKNG